jgi:hypothetical protein
MPQPHRQGWYDKISPPQEKPGMPDYQGIRQIVWTGFLSASSSIKKRELKLEFPLTDAVCFIPVNLGKTH